MGTILDVEETLGKLTIPQRIKLLTGWGWWHTEPIPSAGIPSMRFSDGAHVLLGPTVNIQRSPLGGRSFESFSEDPHLNGTIAAAYINGLQSKGVSATIKHFVANDQEFERFSISSEVSERALREIYLKPFQIAIKHSAPRALMSAYNRVNGIHVSEDKRLLDDILRKEWGYKGLIMSDWTGVYSTTASLLAGVDIEMPGPPVMRGPALGRALMAGKVTVSDIDARVRKVLELVQFAQASGIPFGGPGAPELGIDTPEIRQTLRAAAADATVLLKNDLGLLPLLPSNLKTKKIAVIGPNAKAAMTSGGGSASLRATYAVSPLDGIRAAAADLGLEVAYSPGVRTTKYLPLLDELMYLDGREGAEKGASVDFWNSPPTEDFLSLKPSFDRKSWERPAYSTPTASSYAFLADGIDEEKVNPVSWFSFTTTFIPDEDGDWEFGTTLAGRGNLFLNGNLLIDLSTGGTPSSGDAFFGYGTADVRAVAKALVAGHRYPVELRISNEEFVGKGLPMQCWGGIRVGAIKKVEEAVALEEAVELAKGADVVVLVVGLNHDFESEGWDRETLELPGLTNKLVSEILKANSSTVVVNQSGSAVTMPWVGETSTLLQAFYGGNELGNGLADVLFGRVNPSGKLALTFPKRLEDVPAYPSYGNKGQEHGKIHYNEGIFVGYRGYEIKNIRALFPFGFGLSYSHFAYSSLAVSPISADGSFSVSFRITNTSNTDGREVAQVYIGDAQSSLPRPVKELKGFRKVLVKAGASEEVVVKLDREALAFYDERQGCWVAEKGTFSVLVGASSEDISLSGEVVLERTLTWSGL